MHSRSSSWARRSDQVSSERSCSRCSSSVTREQQPVARRPTRSRPARRRPGRPRPRSVRLGGRGDGAGSARSRCPLSVATRRITSSVSRRGSRPPGISDPAKQQPAPEQPAVPAEREEDGRRLGAGDPPGEARESGDQQPRLPEVAGRHPRRRRGHTASLRVARATSGSTLLAPTFMPCIGQRVAGREVALQQVDHPDVVGRVDPVLVAVDALDDRLGRLLRRHRALVEPGLGLAEGAGSSLSIPAIRTVWVSGVSHAARAHQADADAVAAQVEPQHLGDAAQPELRWRCTPRARACR